MQSDFDIQVFFSLVVPRLRPPISEQRGGLNIKLSLVDRDKHNLNLEGAALPPGPNGPSFRAEDRMKSKAGVSEIHQNGLGNPSLTVEQINDLVVATLS